MSISYVVKYGYSPLTGESQSLAWWENEKFSHLENDRAHLCFEYFKKNRPRRNDIFANTLLLLETDNEGIIIGAHKNYSYNGDDIFIDPTTIPPDQQKVNVPLPTTLDKEIVSNNTLFLAEGAWIVYVKSTESNEIGIIGISRTSKGALDLVNIEIPVMDETRIVYIEYRNFFDRLP